MNKRLLTAAVLILVFGGVSLFVWRVLFFYGQIEAGTLSAQDFSFSDQLSTSELVKAIAQQSTGEADVVSTDDPSIGSEGAALTIVEFGDFGCPYTKQVSYAARRLAELYGTKVRYIYRDFPLVDLHPTAALAAYAGACAHDQHGFWAYHDKLFQNQEDFSEETLLRYAEQVGLDLEEFQECMSNQMFVEEVAEDLTAGIAAGVSGTPTFFFNGRKVEGAIPEDIFEALIETFVSESET